MIAINFSTARGRLKDFCDRVTDRGETVIVTRKAEKNVVIISEERFNEQFVGDELSDGGRYAVSLVAHHNDALG